MISHTPMISQIINSQAAVEIEPWAADIERALAEVWRRSAASRLPELNAAVPLVTVEFVTPEDMQALNRETRAIDRVTDVLSFPMLVMTDGELTGPLEPGDLHPDKGGGLVLELGDLVICPERAREQAEAYGHSEQREMVFLAVHGMCHLCGYDHLAEPQRLAMEAEQKAVMAALGISRVGEVKAAPADQGDPAVEQKTEMADPAAGTAAHSDIGGLGMVQTAGGQPFRSGFVALVGRPNAGKSTLLNHISGAHLAIVSRKAQTTRHSIRSVVNTDRAQFIFVDTPGMHKPQHQLGRNMMKDTWASFKDADVVLLMVDGTRGRVTSIEESVIHKAAEQDVPVLVALNKADDIHKESLLPIIARYQELYPFKAIVPISAKTGDGVDSLMDLLYQYLPEGPRYFDEDSFTDQSERTLAAEMIREQILNYTHDEIPHGTAVKIDRFEESFETADSPGAEAERRIVRIMATVYCERDTHKGILIGKRGQSLKRIGTAARRNIEQMLGCQVYLEIFVKVRKDWQNQDSVLKTLNYEPLNL